MMRFEDDEPVYCEKCGEPVFAGNDYYRYHDMTFCSLDCLGDWLVSDADANDEIEIDHIQSAEDKMDEWADREYHRRVEEEDD